MLIYAMYEQDSLEKKSETASYFGNLKMERVIKDENDEHKTGSLVFRIKRTLPETNDDSGIKCSSPSSEEMSTEEQVESCLSPIKVRIPKVLFDEAESVMELSRNECNSSEDVTIKDKKNNWDILTYNPTPKKVEVDPGDTNTLKYNPESEIKFCKRSRRTTSKMEIPTELRRRSRRIVDLQLQKECHKSPSVDVSNIDKSEILEHKGTGCENSEMVSTNIVKKRKNKKVVFKDLEPKKRKYTRRGRTPKSAIQNNLQNTQSFTGPISSGNSEVNTKNVQFPPPKNSVWTLVPRSLFESEFFKSQVINIRPIQPREQIRFTTSNVFSPPTIPQSLPPPCVSNTRIRLKYPKNFVNPVPAIRPKLPEHTSYKRPIVIHFKKKFNGYFTNHDIVNNVQSEFNNKTESMKISEDLLHLCNKYRMLDDSVIRNFYELNKHSINETDSMLSDLFSRILDITTDDKIENVKQDTLTNNCVSETGSIEAATSSSEMGHMPSPCSTFKNIDTLSCSVIVESLNILYSEEAVLQ